MSFRKNLEYLRKGKNFSQEELAFKLNVSRQAVSKWESGGAYPETDKMLSMCKIFNCTLDELMNDDIAELKKDQERKYSFNDLVDEVTDIVKRTFHMFDNMNIRSIFRFLFEMFLLILAILILHIPFNYLFQLGSGVFVNIPGNISQLFISLWNLITEVVYIVVAVVTFVYIYKIRFLDKFEEVKKIDIKNDDKENEITVKQEINRNKSKKVEIRNYDFGVFSFIGKVALLCIKCFIAFLSLPIIFLLLCSVAGVVIGIVFMYNGVFFIGIIILLLSAIIFTIGLQYIIYNFIVNHRSNWQKLFVVFLISILGFGIGVGITVLEFTKMTVSSQAPMNVKNTIKVETYKMRDNLLLQSAPSYIEYVVDNSLVDSIKVEVAYYDVFTKDIVMKNDEATGNIFIYHESNDSIRFGELYDILIQDLKNRTLSNYTVLGQIEVKVYTSEDNIRKLQEYIDKQNSINYAPIINDNGDAIEEVIN